MIEIINIRFLYIWLIMIKLIIIKYIYIILIDCEADFLRIAFYCIAALVEDIDVCKSFDEVDISEVLYKITEYNQNESDIPILRNLFCAISRLCAYDEYYLIKQHLGKTGIIKNIVALLKEFSSQDESNIYSY